MSVKNSTLSGTDRNLKVTLGGETFTKTEKGWTVARQYIGMPDTWTWQHPVDLDAPPGPTLIKRMHLKWYGPDKAALFDQPCSLCRNEAGVVCSLCEGLFTGAGFQPIKTSVVHAICNRLLELGEDRRAKLLTTIHTRVRETRCRELALTRYRRDCGLTQVQLAAKWGVTQQQISAWERGKRPIPDFFRATIDRHGQKRPRTKQKQQTENTKYATGDMWVRGTAYLGMQVSDFIDPKSPISALLDPESEEGGTYDDELDECAVG